MTAVPEPQPLVVYDGPGVGTELWGMTSASFSFPEPSGRRREVSVQVNDAAMEYLAKQLGRENSDEFRGEAVRTLGEAMLRRLLASRAHIPPEVTVSRWVLAQQPELVEALRPLAAPPAPVAA